MMDKLKYRIDILKFKVTIFTSLFAGIVYLVVNYEKISRFISPYWFAILIFALLAYALIGYLKNLGELSKIDENIKKEAK